MSQTMTVSDLHTRIDAIEQSIAPGSETSLRDEYAGNLLDETGCLPWSDDAAATAVAPAVAAYWIAAYEYLATHPNCEREEWMRAAEEAS